MMKYKNVEVKLDEAEGFYSGDCAFQVQSKNGLVYRAMSRYGETFALSGQQAFEDMKRLIDRNVP